MVRATGLLHSIHVATSGNSQWASANPVTN